MRDIQTFIVNPGTPEVMTIARWRAEGIPVLEVTAEQERRSLEIFTSDQSKQVALIAKRGDIPVGTCLLVPSEIDPNHSLTPWLAGLFVAPEYRRQGAGEILVRSIEEHASKRGFSRLYLYSDDAVGYYERLGWHVVDRTNWKGFDTALMVRDV